jgi:transposase
LAQEAARVAESSLTLAEAARTLGVVEQTLSTWVKAHRAGQLKEVNGKTGVTAEQMEISRLRAELARVKMERDISRKVVGWLMRSLPLALKDGCKAKRKAT